jgi:hypothetical protein
MPAVTCQHCIHFRPNAINPVAGMGSCAKGNGMWHPAAPHLCKQREVAGG